MSTTRHQDFRSFLTERFTAVAVEIFGEVETIVEAYYEENKRLRSILHMVLNPEIKLPRIDFSPHTGAATDVSVQHPELNTNVDPALSEPLAKRPKEEQIEHDISLGSQQQQQQQGLGEADHVITAVCVKSDPDEEEADEPSMPRISDTFHIKVVDFNPDSSTTLSAEEARDECEERSLSESDAASDCAQLSLSEPQKHNRKSATKKKSKRSLQKTLLELPRMISMKSCIAAPNDCQSFLSRLNEAFKDFPDDEKPLIAKVGLTENVELVDCAFGKVPKGSPLSYQCPVPSSQDYKPLDDALPRPLLPLSYHKLKPVSDYPALTAKEQEHLNVMEMTWESAYNLEFSTRSPCGQEKLVEELRKLRLTSRFKEICKLKPGRSNVELLIFKIQKGIPSCKMAHIKEEMKTEAIQEYCKHLCLNWYPCGLVVHPNAPWLGALPDGLVYDPREKRRFGLVHVKCVTLRSFIDSRFLVCRDGGLKLRKSHSCYWHIQGEMMVAGTSWCDLLVVSNEDILVQRLYRDKVTINAMKKKLDEFFFFHYLPSLF